MADLMREGHALNVAADGAYDLAATLSERRALDARIAEKVMGWTNVFWRMELRGCPPEYPNISQPVPYFSTDVAAAWLIVERMERGTPERLVEITKLGIPPRWRVEFRDCGEPFATYTAEEQTAPLAICRAALAATAP